jgi:antibiotic biosynthesis monooxygenase (ABM) superfamily enzyme
MSSQAPHSGSETATLSSPVSIMVSRFVFQGHEAEYQRWALRVLEAAQKFPNNLGAVILSPGTGPSNLHHLVHRFADEASLRTWESSEIRQNLSREADAFSTSQRQQATGMEIWFSLPESPAHPPPAKWKMAIITFFAAYLLTLGLIPLEWIAIPEWPFPVANILTNVLLAGLMTYAVMPGSGRIFRRWLYPGSSTR